MNNYKECYKIYLELDAEVSFERNQYVARVPHYSTGATGKTIEEAKANLIETLYGL